MAKIRRGSVWDFDNPDDYYEQFDAQPPAEPKDDESDDCDGDCEYWESGCYGRA